ncbi:hypothetical protein [Pandoraea sp. PE-S2R-1]|uniref:hypothetical protein n=1 Tax=Pandoraea sp. PE-S2R-1 TaxID=1986994 RepID=UPI0014824F2C|nr:hypothetical protein [Pandoraea sp. PE-S2R-1]
MKLSVSVDHDALAAAKAVFVKAASRAVTVIVTNDKPSVCIGCGAVRQPNGEMPCDH